VFRLRVRASVMKCRRIRQAPGSSSKDVVGIFECPEWKAAWVRRLLRLLEPSHYVTECCRLQNDDDDDDDELNVPCGPVARPPPVSTG